MSFCIIFYCINFSIFICSIETAFCKFRNDTWTRRLHCFSKQNYVILLTSILLTDNSWLICFITLLLFSHPENITNNMIALKNVWFFNKNFSYVAGGQIIAFTFYSERHFASSLACHSPFHEFLFKMAVRRICLWAEIDGMTKWMNDWKVWQFPNCICYNVGRLVALVRSPRYLILNYFDTHATHGARNLCEKLTFFNTQTTHLKPPWNLEMKLSIRYT